uniref:Uncharacterized protein n=1 Tax=Ditylenchus dipsaci TaxID=166011 RepID=A0A915DXB6_9BILA
MCLGYPRFRSVVPQERLSQEEAFSATCFVVAPPVSSPPLMVVSCISSTEKPPKTAVPVSSNEKPNTSEALANASKQVTERTTEAVTVDPHTGAKQPKKLTEAQFRAHAIEYMRRVREKEAREEAEEAAGNTEAETAITEKTLDPTQKSADTQKSVDATQNQWML